MQDLHVLPKVRDSWSYLYIDHARIEQEAKAIAVHDAEGKTPVPCASLMALMLGPGTTITHAAIQALAESGCLVVWTGEEGVRFYAQGMGETRSSRRLLRQAVLYSDPNRRLEVVIRMYKRRFAEAPGPGLTLRQIRGLEGVRVREAYAQASRETGVAWSGRSYRRDNWNESDPVNRALSCANSALYGICHAAILSAGYSPALGFVHTGKMLSFVYDVADLYKADLSIPVAFRTVAEGTHDLERRVRLRCRDVFHVNRLLGRIIDDIEDVLGDTADDDPALDSDQAAPGGLWDPDVGAVAGGENYSDDEVVADDGVDS